MDYGGHDSVFEENLVMALGRKSCIGFGSFKPGHRDIVQNNKCLVGLETISSPFEHQTAIIRDSAGNQVSKELDNVGGLVCKGANAILRNNRYYTPNGNASYECYDVDGEVSFEDIKQKYGLEQGSTSEKIPPLKVIIQWARSLLIEDSQLTDK